MQRWLTDGPLGVSESQINAWIDRAEQEVRDNAGQVSRGVVSGATVAAEIIAGLALADVLLFFLLNDGRSICAWLLDLVPAAHRVDAGAIGERAWATLGGYLRGVTPADAGGVQRAASHPAGDPRLPQRHSAAAAMARRRLPAACGLNRW